MILKLTESVEKVQMDVNEVKESLDKYIFKQHMSGPGKQKQAMRNIKKIYKQAWAELGQAQLKLKLKLGEASFNFLCTTFINKLWWQIGKLDPT